MLSAAHDAGVEPAQGVAAQAPESEASAPVTLATPSMGSSAPAEADAAAEPAPNPAKEEPQRPRRNGWWQRARASVIGE
jgi:ribonuclease E